MKSQIFIGSSKEGLSYIEQIKQLLEPVGDCIVWTTAFTQNRSALDSLVKKTKLTEFAILVATSDDLTIKRRGVVSEPRDNIIFEFGLFTGAMGIDRVFLLAEEDADLPSDLEGIIVARFSNDSTSYNSVHNICENIRQHILKTQESSQLGLLPSTALALGYYNSFVKGVCAQIKNNKLIATESGTLKLKSFELQVIIPQGLDTDGVTHFRNEYNEIHDLRKAQTVVSNKNERDFPFHLKINPEDQDLSGDIDVRLFDVPTTLSTIVESIKLFLPTDKIGIDADLEYLERRELENFIKVLKILVAKNSLTKSVVTIIGNVIL